MINTSTATGRSALYRPVSLSGVMPNKRCKVLASTSNSLRSVTACCKRAAAFPVGAAKAIFKFLSCSNNSCNNRNTIVVLPVPGPPEITLNCRLSAIITATFCQSMLSCILLGHSAKRCRRLSGALIGMGFKRASTNCVTCCSSCQ